MIVLLKLRTSQVVECWGYSEDPLEHHLMSLIELNEEINFPQLVAAPLRVADLLL